MQARRAVRRLPEGARGRVNVGRAPTGRLPRLARPRSIAGVVRLVLVLVLVHGLAPGLSEIGEALVHYARTGHVAHTAADHGDLGDQGSEHGCGATQHLCACCATQAVATPSVAVVDADEHAASEPSAPPETTLARREAARPFRPPIS